MWDVCSTIHTFLHQRRMIDFAAFDSFRTETQIVESDTEDAGGHGKPAEPFQRAFPNTH